MISGARAERRVFSRHSPHASSRTELANQHFKFDGPDAINQRPGLRGGIMFGLIVTLSSLTVVAQDPEYVSGYKPKVGDKVVLARDEAGRRVPTTKNEGAAISFLSIIEGSEFNYEAVATGSDELNEIDGGTPAQIVGISKTRTPIFKVKILEGPSKGKSVFTYGQFCRKLDPAYVKAAAESRKKRGPLDKKAIAAEVSDALAKAKPNEASADLSEKKKLVREAVKPICEKHKADTREINAIATQAGVFVKLDGSKYDVAGNRMKD
jgi:hypothetical protein